MLSVALMMFPCPSYLEIELTKGKREVTEDDEREADALCKRYLERWKEELE